MCKFFQFQLFRTVLVTGSKIFFYVVQKTKTKIYFFILQCMYIYVSNTYNVKWKQSVECQIINFKEWQLGLF